MVESAGGKLRTLQALRAVAALGIVCVHLSAPHGFEVHYLGGPRLTEWMHLPGRSGVDLFFVISGAIMTITTWDRFASPRAAREFLYRRVTRIHPLYWIVTTLVLVVYLVDHGAVNAHSAHPPDVLASYLILPQRGDPLLSVGWTLVYEMYFYAVFSVALLLGRRRFPWIIGGWTLATVLLHVALHIAGARGESPYLVVASDLLNVEFVFGIVVGYLVMSRRVVASRALLAGGSLSVGLLLAYCASTGAADFPSIWFRVFAIGLSFGVVVYAAIALELTRAVRVPRPLERLGDASYSLYLWHVPLLALIGLMVAPLVSSSGVMRVSALVAAFALVVLAGLWLYDKLERPLLRAFQSRSFRASLGRRARTVRAGARPAD